MNAPLNNEVLISISNKLAEIDKETKKKIICGSEIFLSLDKKVFSLAVGTMIGMFITMIASVCFIIAEKESNIPFILEMSLLPLSSSFLIGSIVIGGYYEMKKKEKKNQIKKAVLELQYKIVDREKIKEYLSLDDLSFNKTFHDAIYTKEIKNIVEQSSLSTRASYSVFREHFSSRIING